MKSDGLAHRGTDGGSEKGSDLRYILKVVPMPFANRLVVGGKRKRN